jgi:hypothetical protein
VVLLYKKTHPVNRVAWSFDLLFGDDAGKASYENVFETAVLGG